MEIIDLNHVALHVKDIDLSSAFYGEKLGLPIIPRPGFTFPGAWFKLGSSQELHLIDGRESTVVANKRGTHFALQVASTEATWKGLEQHGLEPYSNQTRPDGALQFYLDDPDGHVIEFCQITNLSHG
jgi:catechol 2,3-dioxygenase-like lactoylglutathione lyase family enzyme